MVGHNVRFYVCCSTFSLRLFSKRRRRFEPSETDDSATSSAESSNL